MRVLPRALLLAVLVVLVAPLALVPVKAQAPNNIVPDSTSCLGKVNQNLPGVYIYKALDGIYSALQCAQICHSVPSSECATWTWLSADYPGYPNRCQLQNDANLYYTTLVNAYSATRSDLGCHIHTCAGTPAYDITGNDYAIHSNIVSTTDCANLCFYTPSTSTSGLTSCKAWVYASSSHPTAPRNCYLKSSVGPFVTSSPRTDQLTAGLRPRQACYSCTPTLGWDYGGQMLSLYSSVDDVFYYTGINDNPQSAETAYECARKCMYTRSCTIWVFSGNSNTWDAPGNCYLKKGSGAPQPFPIGIQTAASGYGSRFPGVPDRYQTPGYWGGEYDCYSCPASSRNPAWSPNWEFMDLSFGYTSINYGPVGRVGNMNTVTQWPNESQDSAQACDAACNRDATCRAWTYKTGSHQCRFFDQLEDMGPIYEAGTVSGMATPLRNHVGWTNRWTGGCPDGF
jgi:hypothetical protein